MNLNPHLQSVSKPDPAQLHRELEADLRRHAVACNSSFDCTEMRRVLQSGSTAARLIYVYCHGQPAAAGHLEELELAPGCKLRPTSLAPESRFATAPIVFLNACSSGSSSPLLFTGFLSAFYRQGALGLIATNFSVPIAFGARFGADVIRACLFPRKPLSEEVRALRSQYAAQGNPVPLFYSVQCQHVLPMSANPP